MSRIILPVVGVLIGVLAAGGAVTTAPTPDAGQFFSLEEPTALRGATTAPSQEAKPLSPTEIYEKISPSVVRIEVLDEDGKTIGQGSGFVIHSKRLRDWEASDQLSYPMSAIHVVTNYHVIRGAVGIRLSCGENRIECDASILTEDAVADLAILDAMVFSTNVPPRVPQYWPRGGNQATVWDIDDLEALITGELALPRAPHVGDKVFAIGSPHGLTNTLSEGLISGFRKTEGSNWIQTTAPISHGSSGGPLLDSEGNVIGVVTASLSEGQNLNFAIPVSEVDRLLEEKHAGRSIWKGASIRKVEETAYSQLLLVMGARFARRQPESSRFIPTGDPSQLRENPEFARYILSDESPDQRSLLVKGYHQYLGNNYSAARETLKRAIDAPMADDEGDRVLTMGENLTYLAHYTLASVLYQAEWKAVREGTSTPKNSRPLPSISSFDDAIEALKKARKEKPDFAPTLLLLAQCYDHSCRYAEMLVEAELLVRLVPRCAEAYETRGDAYERLKRYAEALEDYKTAVELRPTNILASLHVGEMYA
ncbi:MAG: tetratricopeptide repeat protein, partial [Planctomycetes bacterium]|nr:tetratricopeptide repeat protein [Planctomycetota bacterium]